MISRSVCLLAVVLFLQSLLISNSQANPQKTIFDKNNNSKIERISIAVTVDPRIELLSIIFRLAGNTEYNQCKIPKYDKDIKKTFHSYEEHAVVKYAKEIRKKYWVSCDAPMSLAVYLSDVNSLGLLVPLEPRPLKLDSRWKPEETKEFLEKAKLFVQDSNFLAFFNEHKQLYKKASEKFQKMLEENANLQWFDEYFATGSKPRFNIVLGMANGPSSYGPSAIIDDTQYNYSIIGARRTDLFGNPVFNMGFVCTVIHELGHSYVNPIVQRNFSQLKPAGKVLFPKVKDKMEKMGYGSWQTMIIESVNRVCTIQYYYHQKDYSTVDLLLKYEVKNGFYWTRELNEVVRQYNTQRDKYPTFESFFPRIIEFFGEYAKKEGNNKILYFPRNKCLSGQFH